MEISEENDKPIISIYTPTFHIDINRLLIKYPEIDQTFPTLKINSENIRFLKSKLEDILNTYKLKVLGERTGGVQ